MREGDNDVVLRVPSLSAHESGIEFTRIMLSDASLEADGQDHASVVMFHCAAMAFKAHLARIRYSVFLAPIDVFYTSIVLEQQGSCATDTEHIKHSRLVARSSEGFMSDVVIVISSANGHFTLTIAIRASRNLYLLDSFTGSRHSKLVSGALTRILTIAFDGAAPSE
ncbi:hypothetical protein T492DRAFT_835677 [Pavlovales sp. CCMP2436]|nr:hypothetical protein T492DRAFT_835677 [Pavlovales sp. CCMP2436]